MKVFYFILGMLLLNTFVDCSAAVKLGWSDFDVDPTMQIDEHRLCVILNNRADKNQLLLVAPGAYLGCEIVNILHPVRHKFGGYFIDEIHPFYREKRKVKHEKNSPNPLISGN